MIVKIEITKGCTCYSHRINGIDYEDLVNSELKENYNPLLVNAIFDTMYEELEQQNIDVKVLELIDHIRAHHSLQDLKYLLTFMFEYNKNTKLIDTWTCDECFDTVTIEVLVIKVENLDNIE